MAQHKRSLWLAVALSPWAAPLAFIGGAFLYLAIKGNFDTAIAWQTAVAFLVFGLPTSYAATILLGVPYVLWIRRLGFLNYAFVCLGAVVAGAIALPTLIWLIGGTQQHFLQNVGLGMVLGLISGIAFSMIAGLTIQSRGSCHASRATSPYLRR